MTSMSSEIKVQGLAIKGNKQTSVMLMKNIKPGVQIFENPLAKQ